VTTRRAFLGTLTGCLLTATRAAEAQPTGKVYRLAYLGASSPELESEVVAAFRQGLRDLGYVEGQNIVIEYRWAEGRYDRYPALVAEIVRLKVDVIVTEGTPGALAAKEGAGAIPTVMAVIGDPIALGVVASLARPGGNITGLSSMSLEVDGKRLELLKEMVPGVSRVAVFWNPANPNNTMRLDNMRAAAKALRLTLEPLVDAGDNQRLEKGFRAIVAARSQALINQSDRGALLAHRARIVEFAAKHRLPAFYANREFVEVGGLASYAASYPAIFRRAATYVDKILKGAKPGDLPIERPTTFELSLNLKAAKAIGLTIPQSLLRRADEVIQ
jgi:putative tryptophan/tyrosine transport system substrate-binding protein